MRPRRVDWRNASDADLAAGFADGNDPCLEESFRRWGSLIYTITYRALGSASEAEDVTSDANVKVESEPLVTLIDRLVLVDEVQRLPHPRGTILRMAFWEGQSYSQIAERLQLPLGTVKSHSRRALRQLRARLEEVTSWST